MLSKEKCIACKGTTKDKPDVIKRVRPGLRIYGGRVFYYAPGGRTVKRKHGKRGTVTLRNMQEGWSAIFVAYNDGQLVYVDFMNNANTGCVFVSPSVEKYDTVKLFILTAGQWRPILALADLLN